MNRMEFVKKYYCKRVLGNRSKRLLMYSDDEDSSSIIGSDGNSSSYSKVVRKNKQQQQNIKLPPHGCLCVYVGPERQRFVIKIKIVNHPLFKKLLEAAQNEYGYRNDGPLCLPCDIHFFSQTLVEIKAAETDQASA